ncbi:hypothetical protein Pyn_00241 [Prunus yedoensis var. nudiflora]|uniref:Uncharacterized protein n=1 Tax=Prunus yedoensis var. nudiflora TaxID=2094558 RepID=A0A314Z0D8_PRUYE|nr:hypothetical protein Pyn_00241 [Prunus yedoensis var. nudiflora]
MDHSMHFTSKSGVALLLDPWSSQESSLPLRSGTRPNLDPSQGHQYNKTDTSQHLALSMGTSHEQKSHSLIQLQHKQDQAILKSQHLRRKALSSIVGRNAQMLKKEKQRMDHLKNLEDKMNQILRGVKDVQNLRNSLCAQNEILQQSHAELVEKVDAQQDQGVTGTKDTSRTSSKSMGAETSEQVATNTRAILKEKRAWWESNKRLVGSL